jgi:hypothetical protein
MSKIWELDFYSRPIVDENNKKLWEVLICESYLNIKQPIESDFKYSKFTSNQSVNSLWLTEALKEAIDQANVTPKKIRFFRRQMNNMIVKACEDLGILACPSRRTYGLNQWLEQRTLDFYPKQPGFQDSLTQVTSVQYPETITRPLPDALRAEKNDQWAFVSLEAQSLEDMDKWNIGFKEAFPLNLGGVDKKATIPGLVIYSSRSLPLAAWLSGLELASLKLNNSSLNLATGDNDSWLLLNFPNQSTLNEAIAFENAKKTVKGIHFLAIQASSTSETFSGFWLLW